MRHGILSVFCAFLFSLASARAADRGVWVGGMLGEPTGATLKLWIDQDEAWSFGLGFNPFGENSFQLHADYLLHNFELGNKLNVPSLAWYAGLGARFNGPDETDSFEPGIRFPAGLTYFLESRNMELFAEFAPVLDLSPDIEIDINCVAGVRYFGW
ncbi:MAG: hypothetical protein R6X19_09695 [Kiritimatiellia bacterium]